MKAQNLILLITIVLSTTARAQDAKEIPVTSEIERVTVFLQNAQIIRKKNGNFNK